MLVSKGFCFVFIVSLSSRHSLASQSLIGEVRRDCLMSQKDVCMGGYSHSNYNKDVLMASLMATAFLFCPWFGSTGKTPRWSCTPCSHSSLKSSPMTSQKLCNTQQAAMTRQTVSTLRSSLFAMLLNLPFSLQ